LKTRNIYCIEDCASAKNEHEDYTYDEQQQQFEITNGDVPPPKFVNNNIVSLCLERTLMMTNINLQTLNLGKINQTIIEILGKYCYKLTHLSCELPHDNFLLFIKLLETLKALEHLKLKLKLSPIISDNYIVAFAGSLPNSLRKLGLNIYDEEGGNDEFIYYFLRILLENLYCTNLSELEFYNEQMIMNDNLRLILQFALSRIGVGGYGSSNNGGRFKSFKYARENYNVDFDHALLQSGREIIQIECEKISDFYRPFYEPFGYEND
jgi:hypothetical protein